MGPSRRTHHLHAGRCAVAGGAYFVTMVTAGRQPWLPGRPAEALLEYLRGWHEAGAGEVLAVTVLPDHAHLLIRPARADALGRTVAAAKHVARSAAPRGVRWQRDFWEERVRAETGAEPYARYVFLNPYRAGLLAPEAVWPWTWLPFPGQFRFPAALGAHGGPPRAWLAESGPPQYR
jgi:REP element-mobilizing transposase RayT